MRSFIEACKELGEYQEIKGADWNKEINRDPESGYVNIGTYRIQVYDSNLLGLWMSPGQQGRQICERYWERGESCINQFYLADKLQLSITNTP